MLCAHAYSVVLAFGGSHAPAARTSQTGVEISIALDFPLSASIALLEVRDCKGFGLLMNKLTATRARFLCFRGFSSLSRRLRSCLATRMERAMERVELWAWSSPTRLSYVWSICWYICQWQRPMARYCGKFRSLSKVYKNIDSDLSSREWTQWRSNCEGYKAVVIACARRRK